jgi:hypothetical protein
MQSTVEMKMGRLLEIRIKAGFHTVADVDAMFAKVASVVATQMPPPHKHITIADWRRCVLMSGEAATRLQTGMLETNPFVLRAAALASHDSPSAVMQMLRVVRDSHHDERRLFFEEAPLVQWLGQVLTPTESARLRQFLKESAE